MAECIFCGRPFGPQRQRSKEHAAPQWCRDLVPNLGAAHHTLVVRTADGTTETDRGLRDPFTTTVNDICIQCNTGWMHELEEASKPILSHLIQDDARNLQFYRQVLAATWAVKTAMVWESVNPEYRAIPSDEMRRLHATQRPGARQRVWIGRCSGAEPHSARQVAGFLVGPLGEDYPGGPHSYLVALTIGQLALAVYGHTMALPAQFVFPPQFESSLVQIWPPVHEVVAWPPPASLDEGGLDACVQALGSFQEPPSTPEPDLETPET